jgi:hypothetical protein
MRHWHLAILMLVAACSPDYPLDKEGTWRADMSGTTANDANLQAMIVNPHDLIQGVGATTALSAEAAPAVKRLLTGRRLPLLSSDVLQLQSGAAVAPAPQGDDNAKQQ